MEQRLFINISPLVYVFAAVLLLVVPLPWLNGWVIAVLFHEFSHCIALYLCGKQIDGVSLDINGVRIHTEPLSDWQILLCSLAGPMGGLLVILIAHVFPQAAICAALLSIYNLIPIFPFDGGRALFGLLHMILPERICELFCFLMEKLVLMGVIFLGIFATFIWKLSVLPICISALFALRVHRIKIPCKSRVDRVQ